jgi:seryl-tRNA synthetase
MDVEQTQPEARFSDELFSHGLLVPTGVAGIYGRGGAFERVVAGLERLVDKTCAGERHERLRFPPTINRADFEKSQFLDSFPHLAGTVFSFEGSEQAHQCMLERIKSGADWSEYQRMADVVLAPAACYPVYPHCRGVLPGGGRSFDVGSWCFRHEPSGDPARMQAFRMREIVRIGSMADVLAFRETWLERGQRFLARLGVETVPEPAADPFFGRGGKLLAVGQREQKLKFELCVPICSEHEPTAVMSFNYHQQHFGQLFDIRTADNDVAHTGCVGFGLERIVLALLKTHGFVPAEWPSEVQRALGP